MKNQTSVVVLKWEFLPPDYLGRQLKETHHDWILTVADGEAEAKIVSAIYDADPSIREAINDYLTDRFRVVQLLSHCKYKLSRSSMTRIHPDGRQDITIAVVPAQIKITAYPIDLQVRDKNGDIIIDSRQDRVQKEEWLIRLVRTFRPIDSILASVLKSYEAAVNDPNNELGCVCKLM